MAEVNAEDHPGAFPWATGKVVLVWGSGAYRKSNVCLAAIPSAQIETKSAIRYFSGLGGGTPTWSASEADAVPATCPTCGLAALTRRGAAGAAVFFG